VLVGADVDAVDEFAEELLDLVGAVVPDGMSDTLAHGVQVFDIWHLWRGGLNLQAEFAAPCNEFIATAGEFSDAWRAEAV
jgi:hypothetical protein